MGTKRKKLLAKKDRYQEMYANDLLTLSELKTTLARIKSNAKLIIRRYTDEILRFPELDYALPTKECSDTPGATAEDPCEMFSRIPFPTRQFTPTGCDHRKDCRD